MGRPPSASSPALCGTPWTDPFACPGIEVKIKTVSDYRFFVIFISGIKLNDYFKNTCFKTGFVLWVSGGIYRTLQISDAGTTAISYFLYKKRNLFEKKNHPQRLSAARRKNRLQSTDS
jgi:hypothetical protein